MLGFLGKPMSLGVETYWDVCIPVASVGRKYGTPI